MTRFEAEAALAELRAELARLQGRAAFLQTCLLRQDAVDPQPLPRPGWPIRRAQPAAHGSGRRSSTSASPRTAV